MSSACLLNGSLRGAASSSLAFIERLDRRMRRAGIRVDHLAVKASVDGDYPPVVLDTACNRDVLVIAFPLFSYTLPGGLTRFLEDLYDHARKGGAVNRRMEVYAIVNCGYPDPAVCTEAIRVVRNFCARMGVRYGFSIAIGTGPVTAMSMRIPFINPRLKRAFKDIVLGAGEGNEARHDDCFVKPILPKAILLRIKEHYERKTPALSASKR